MRHRGVGVGVVGGGGGRVGGGGVWVWVCVGVWVWGWGVGGGGVGGGGWGYLARFTKAVWRCPSYRLISDHIERYTHTHTGHQFVSLIALRHNILTF